MFIFIFTSLRYNKVMTLKNHGVYKCLCVYVCVYVSRCLNECVSMSVCECACVCL